MLQITTENTLYRFVLNRARLTGEEKLLPVDYIVRIERLLAAVTSLAPAGVPDSFKRPAAGILYCTTPVTLKEERAAPGPRRAYPLNLEKLFRTLVAGLCRAVTKPAIGAPAQC